MNNYIDDYDDYDKSSSPDDSSDIINKSSDNYKKDIMDDDSTTDNSTEKKINKTEHIGYPRIDDENLQSKIYAKREFYYNKMPDRPELDNYDKIKEYRDNICRPATFELLPQQALLSNFINPDTPYKGLLVFHGTGTGKTFAAIAIAEKFKTQVQRYGTPIHVLVPGPLLKENWRESIIKGTGNAYIKNKEDLQFLNAEQKEKIEKQAISMTKQYYNIMSYKSFTKRVLGEKIIERKDVSGKTVYKKTEDGKYERELSLDRINNLNNSLLIVDEAHNIISNDTGDAIIEIIKKSTNLKVVLLTATPMSNLADDIVYLLNILRPENSKIQRDKIFTVEKNFEMKLKPDGLEYLKKMAHGYVSHLRGADPITFAKKIEVGTKPKGLLFTKVSRCQMDKFQRDAYDEAVKEINDGLDKNSTDAANFVFPILDESKKNILGVYGKTGFTKLSNQIKSNYDKLNNLIGTQLLGLDKVNEDYISINPSTNTISGKILHKKYLHIFSTKFAKALDDIYDNLFNNNGKKESRTGFIYSNLVKIGIQIFQEVLLQNGFLEFDENPANYKINNNTVCYYCGNEYSTHKDDKNHSFAPATFVAITGAVSEESAEVQHNEQKQKAQIKVFKDIKNKDGKYIKLVLGSRVMSEGLSLANVATVQILDVYYNFGLIDQVIGRGIRHCSHYDLMSEDNPFPEVKLFRYVVSLKKNEGISSEEKLYQKAEIKYLLVNKVERVLKKIAIDCALMQQGNMFQEEVKEFKECINPNKDENQNMLMNQDDYDTNKVCPARCNFESCEYQCDNKLLNTKYYDPDRRIYKKLKKVELDTSTFVKGLAQSEIDYAKRKIKELFMTGYVHNLNTITEYVYNSYNKEKRDLFDEFFVQKALDELIPVSENDLNNFKDIIYDKTRRAGYLIYLDGYYFYQPFDENENVPMFYRTQYNKHFQSKLSLSSYLEKFITKGDTSTNKKLLLTQGTDVYDFDKVLDYYDARDEYEIVGIIDKENNRRKTKRADEMKDVFKIREERAKILDKKRAVGLPSFKGAVCAVAKDKKYLLKVANNLGIKEIKTTGNEITREDICNNIMDKLVEKEKYATGDDKKTYIMIPYNHPIYKFPLNLEDRVKYIKNDIHNLISKDIKFDVDKTKNSNKEIIKYTISFNYSKKIDANILQKLTDSGWTNKTNTFTLIVE